MHVSLDMYMEEENWKSAAIAAGNLSELQLTRGDVSLAIKAAVQSVELADKSGDAFRRRNNRTTLADTQHQAGDLATAHANFEEAETLQKELQAANPQLYSLGEFRYCDLLLAAGEWKEAQQRAEYALNIVQNGSRNLLDIALNNLSLGRASLQQVITLAISQLENKHQLVGWISAASSTNCPLDTQLLPKLEASTTADDASLSALRSAENWINQAVEGLRKAGVEDYIIRGLLARASYYRYAISFNTDITQMELTVSGEPPAVVGISTHSTERHAGYQCALRDLQEVHDIAQRSGMRLHLTDYHLESTRLLLTRLIVEANSHSLKELSSTELELKTQAIKHIELASELIDETGYKRRTSELLYLQDCVAQIFE